MGTVRVGAARKLEFLKGELVCDMRSVLKQRFDGMGKPLKKTTPDQAAAGLEPGTSLVQSAALDAWPRCSVSSERNSRQLCYLHWLTSLPITLPFDQFRNE
jgi:hypothetical protein